MTEKSDLIVSLYQRGLSSHELRLTRIDDSEHNLSDQEKFCAGKTRQQLERETSRILSMPTHFPEDLEFDVLPIELYLDRLSEAEADSLTQINGGEVIGLGFTSPSDETPIAIPQTHWLFLTVDFDESKAVGEEISYVGLRFLERSQLLEAELQVLTDNQQSSSDLSLQPVQTSVSPADSLSMFREMENLAWPEVHISLVAGDLIEVSARGQTKRATYGEFALIDRRRGQGKLNSAGRIFLAMATRSTSISEVDKKNLSRLRKAFKETLGIAENPFYMPTHVQRHTPRFTLEDARDKADQRAKERTGHVSYEDHFNYDVGSNLSDELADRIEEYSYEDADDDDPAAPYLKN